MSSSYLRFLGAPKSRGSAGFALLLGLAVGLAPAALRASPEKLARLDERLELAGVPVEILNPDLDRDGLRDLAIVVASTTWGETMFEEETRLDDAGTLVDVLTVVPTVLDRRQVLFFRGRAEGGFESPPRSLELPPAVHAVAAGPSGAPLVAWTDEGISEIVLGTAGEADSADRAASEIPSADPIERGLELVPRVTAGSLLSGSRSFVPRSGLARDIDGDGEDDLLLPVERGLAVYRGSPEGIAAAPSALLEPPADFSAAARRDRARRMSKEEDEPEPRSVNDRPPGRDIYLPELVDLDGDRRKDLLYRDPGSGGSERRGRLSRGGFDFGAPFDPLGDTDLEGGREVVWVGDLDGAPGAELVISEEIRNEKDSMRAELAEAKRPRARLSVHRLDARGLWNPKPDSTFEIEGYVFEGGGSDDGDDGDDEGISFELPAGVRDLDGDGKLDLIAIRLDFSLFEAMRVLTTHSIRLGLDFAIYRQGAGLSFREVPGLDLAGELRLRLDDVSLGQIASFSGDFDGDGRFDFVQLGRGRKVTIHRGQEGARYAPDADLTIALEREPADVALVQVVDLDGDGRSDLAVTQPVDRHQIGARAALELHLSRRAP